MTKAKKQYYVVVHGRQPGIYTTWFGEDGASKQVENFTDAIYKGFYSKEDALVWLREFSEETLRKFAPNLLEYVDYSKPVEAVDHDAELLNEGKVVIHTDGCALGNPGQGGFAAILRYKEKVKEITGGFRETTNNRMEIMACIEGLKSLKQKSSVVVFSDSKYLVDSIDNKWVYGWRNKNWMKSKSRKVPNADLWKTLLELTEQHEVEFRWVRGHNIDKSNQRCDFLAGEAAQKPNLPVDAGFNLDDLQSSLFDNHDSA
jgi:ribonuclease HI